MQLCKGKTKAAVTSSGGSDGGHLQPGMLAQAAEARWESVVSLHRKHTQRDFSHEKSHETENKEDKLGVKCAHSSPHWRKREGKKARTGYRSIGNGGWAENKMTETNKNKPKQICDEHRGTVSHFRRLKMAKRGERKGLQSSRKP